MRPLLGLIPFALLAGLSLPALAGTISIEGRGEVTASPDTAYVTSGVTTQGATAREALDLNTKAMTDLMTELKASGIEERDIQTSGFSVSPNYVYSEERDANGYTLPPKINGYQVSNVVTVRVRALDTLGAILDKSVTVGANTINGVSFAVADTSDLLDEARKAAFADARAKAELYATASGSKLEDIVSINESQNFGQPQPYEMRSMAAAAPQADVPVATGELSFAINVSVQWELEDAGK
jgi:uncharacterized protein